MSIRFPQLVVLDVYGTLLKVHPDFSDQAAFEKLFRRYFPGESPPGFEEFWECLEQDVRESHQVSLAAGVRYPEVQWQRILLRRLPGVLGDTELTQFAAELMQCRRRTSPAEGAMELLRFLRSQSIPLGILSNAQPYTLLELSQAFPEMDPFPKFFDADFVFWSWRHGFSKPSPEAFQIIASRAEGRGIRRENVLLIGDRKDNDILPAEAAGFQTWHVTETPGRRLGDLLCEMG